MVLLINPLFPISIDILIPASISKITIVTTSAIKVIPLKSLFFHIIKNSPHVYIIYSYLIVLFIPFGIFISDYLKAKRISHILIVSTLISLTAELIQYNIGRAFDVDDIILNVVGAILGFMVYISIQAIKQHLPRFLQNNIFYNIIAIIILIAVIILFGSIWGLNL